MKLKKLNALMLLSGAAVFQAHAGMVQDGNGNVGYDTAAECDAAVQGWSGPLLPAIDQDACPETQR